MCARSALAARLVSIAGRAVAAGGRAEERGRGDVQQQHLHVCVSRLGFFFTAVFFLWNPSITEIFAILVEIKRRFSDTYWDFESG